MDTFEINGFATHTSLNERTIYLKIIDTIQFLNYEANIELKEFKMPITLQDAYTLVTKCFSAEKDHSVSFSKNTNVLRLDFKAKIGGYMNISFDIMLREMTIGDDAKVSMQINEMERRHKKEMDAICKQFEKMEAIIEAQGKRFKKMEAIIEAQEKQLELFGNLTVLSETGNQPINSTDIQIRDLHMVFNFPVYYNCKKANISGNSYEDLIAYKNSSVEELTLSRPFASLNGLSNMPNLKILKLHSGTTGNYLNDLVTVISAYTHTIKKICIPYQTHSPVALQTYCDKNGVDLIVN